MSENKQSVQRKKKVKTARVIVSPLSKLRPRKRRRCVRPVCYTLSSDEEEPVQVPLHPVLEEAHNVFHPSPVRSERCELEYSSTSQVIQNEGHEFNDPQFSGVTDINEQTEVIQDQDDAEIVFPTENMQEELNESLIEEITSDGEEPDNTQGHGFINFPLRCRSIRIGAYRVGPVPSVSYLTVSFEKNGISFLAPEVTDFSKWILLSVRNRDIVKAQVHFSERLQLMFIFTTAEFGEYVRNALHMPQDDRCYFDPTSNDVKTQMLTFLLDNITAEHCHFIQQCFPGHEKVEELDEKGANYLLVKSTPIKFSDLGVPIPPGISKELIPLDQVPILSNVPPITRQKSVQPVCYTLSSDDEEPVQVPSHSVLREAQNVFRFTAQIGGCGLQHSSFAVALGDESRELNDPQFSGVTDINEQAEIEEEPDDTQGRCSTYLSGDFPLPCRCVKIGAYKVYPTSNYPYVSVFFEKHCIAFLAPEVTESSNLVPISIRGHDIIGVRMRFEMGRPSIFILTTPEFMEAVWNTLNMSRNDPRCFDPTANDVETRIITLVIERTTDDESQFMQLFFDAAKIVHEINFTAGSDTLRTSSPNQELLPNNHHFDMPSTSQESPSFSHGVFKMENDSKNNDSNVKVCIICCINPINSSIIHGEIGHSISCFSCAKELQRKDGRCPICRRKIERVVHLISA